MKPEFEVRKRAGKVMRIPGFDLREPGADWRKSRSIDMVREDGPDGVPCYRLKLVDIAGEAAEGDTKWRTGVAAATDTVPLLPNRNYVISALVNCDFQRPIEINVGLRSIDGGGRCVMSQFRGLPDQTNGWQRWEWEITVEPGAAHGIFEIRFYDWLDMHPDRSYDFVTMGRFRIADIAFVELPPKRVKPYKKGRGATFWGGPGNLPMRVEDGKTERDQIVVQTTGARYTFNLTASTILSEQRLEEQREVCSWRLSLPLSGLEVLKQNRKECVLANDRVTFGVQCDSLMVVVPHDELRMECESKIGGRWNRLAFGHLLARDDYGGFAVNPDIPSGSGRAARCNADHVPGRLKAGAMDFSGRINDVTYLSTADPGWRITWFVSPGERLAISVFPPRPFPWADSFDRVFTLTHRSVPTDAYAKFTDQIDILIMWDFFQRSWAMSWGADHRAVDEEAIRSHVAAMKQAGIHPIPYMSGWFYHSLDAKEFAGEVKRLRDTYGFEGVYYDGIPLDWVVAYEEMRLTRELYPDGVLILHHTYPAPLYEGSIELPAIASYADVTWMAELIYGVGRDWPYPKYFTTQYRKANTVGAMLHDHWDWGNRIDKDLMMLGYNGRASAPGLPWKEGPGEAGFAEWVQRYLPVAGELKRLWQEKGGEPDFYERHYLPRWRELTAGQLPE